MKISYLSTAVLILALAVLLIVPPPSLLGQSQGWVETTMISLKIEGEYEFNLFYTWVLPDAPITVRGKLEDSANRGLGSKTMELSSDFGFSATVTTDGFGEFEFGTYAPKAEGLYWIHAEFKGDNNYAGSRKSIAFEVSRATPLFPFLLVAIAILLTLVLIISIHKKQASKRRKITVRCMRCGSLNDDNASYCTYCGYQLVGRNNELSHMP